MISLVEQISVEYEFAYEFAFGLQLYQCFQTLIVERKVK